VPSTLITKPVVVQKSSTGRRYQSTARKRRADAVSVRLNWRPVNNSTARDAALTMSSKNPSFGLFSRAARSSPVT
jgi:hypothetical protein